MAADGTLKGAKVRLNLNLARSLFRLSRIATVWPACFMLMLAVVEVLAVTQGAYSSSDAIFNHLNVPHELANPSAHHG